MSEISKQLKDKLSACAQAFKWNDNTCDMAGAFAQSAPYDCEEWLDKTMREEFGTTEIPWEVVSDIRRSSISDEDFVEWMEELNIKIPEDVRTEMLVI